MGGPLTVVEGWGLTVLWDPSGWKRFLTGSRVILKRSETENNCWRSSNRARR